MFKFINVYSYSDILKYRLYENNNELNKLDKFKKNKKLMTSILMIIINHNNKKLINFIIYINKFWYFIDFSVMFIYFVWLWF